MATQCLAAVVGGLDRLMQTRQVQQVRQHDLPLPPMLLLLLLLLRTMICTPGLLECSLHYTDVGGGGERVGAGCGLAKKETSQLFRFLHEEMNCVCLRGIATV